MKRIRVLARLDIKPPFVIKPICYEGLRQLGDPSVFAQKYYAQGADEIFYMDIVSSLYQRMLISNEVEKVARQIFVPHCVGGAVRSIDDFSTLFHHGADKVAINTYAVQEDASLINKASRIFGSQAVVVHIQAKRQAGHWECFTDSGRIPSGKDVIAWAKEAEDRGAGEIFVSSVDRDGTGRGFDIDLIGSVVSKVNIPVIAGSGAGSIEDIKKMVSQAKPDAVAVASLLHYDKTTISEIKKAINTLEI